MNAKTLKALKGSIWKWRRIVNGTGVDLGLQNCPLCELFYDYPTWCNGCPIYEKTGERECYKTPYDKFLRATKLDSNIRGRVASSIKAKKYAQEELDFLKSLLPPKPKKKAKKKPTKKK